MNPNRHYVEARIASLPIAESERAEALAYVQAGERFAAAVLAILHVFTPHSTPTLRHTH